MTGKTKLTGIGRYLPNKVVTNADIQNVAETSAAWIEHNVGIKERRFCDATEHQYVMGAEAAYEALAKARCSADEIDIILVTTNVPDYPIPSTACLIQNEIGATNAFATDLITACPGYPMALSMADAYIQSGQAEKVLIVATECLSRLTDPIDRTIFSILGDGAAAMVFEKNTESDSGLIQTFSRTVGAHWDAIYIPVGGVVNRPTQSNIEQTQHCIKMDGGKIKNLVQTYFPKAINELLERTEFSLEQIDWVVPHQANLTLLRQESQKMGIEFGKLVTNIEKYGNTSSASIPIALYDLINSNNLTTGDLILMPAFGAGFGYGAALYRW